MRFGPVALSACLLFAVAACDGELTDPGLPVPGAITIVQGDAQTGTVGTTLGTALVVQVTDTAGAEVEGISVIWSTDDGSLSAASTTTDAFGVAAVGWTLGTEAGEQTVTASVSGADPVTFRATAEPAAASRVEVADDSLTFLVGDTVQLSAAVTDAHANVVGDAEIVWMSLDSAVARIDSASGALVGVASGTARITATSGEIADTVQVTIQDPDPSLAVDWHAAYPLTGMTLHGAWAASASDVFVVGGSGPTGLPGDEGAVILHFDGTYWSRMAVDIGTPLSDVWGSSASDVFAVGDAGVILHYDGSTWTEMESPTTEHLSGVRGTSGTNVFAVGHDGGIFHYDGSAWSVAFSGSLVELNDVWGTSATDMYAVGTGGVIRHWDGSAWQAMDTPTDAPLYAIWGSGSDNIYAVGGTPGNGIVLQYDGTEWVERTSVNPVNVLRAVTGTSDSRVMVAGPSEAIRFDGSLWTPMDHRLNPAFQGATGDDNGAIYVVGGAGSIFRNGSGTDWQIAHSTAAANDLWAASENTAFRVGDFGTILRFDGTGWIAMPSPTTTDLTGVWGHDGESVYAVGDDQILYYDGNDWVERVTGLTGTFTDIHGLGLNDIYVAGSDGVAHFDGDTWSVVEPTTTTAVWADPSGVVHAVGGFDALRYDDPDWTAVPNPFGGSFGTSLWGDGPNYLLGCTTGADVFHYDGEQWQPNEIDVPCTDVHGLSRHDVFVVGADGQIHHRSGTGLGWTNLSPADIGLDLHAVFGTETRIFVGGGAGLILHGER